MRGSVIAKSVSLAVLAASFAFPATTHAQNTPPQPAVLNGTVKDVDGKPLRDVVIDVSGVKKHAVTDDRGRFRITKLTTEPLVMIVRRVGMVVMTFDVNLIPGDNEVNITMEPLPQVLDVVRSATEQSGLFGVVGDTGFTLIEGASVATIVHKSKALTNDKGQFFFDPVQAGADVVDVRKLGFRPRIVSFTMPPKGGQRLAIWLTPLPSGLDDKSVRQMSAPSNALVQELFDFSMRRHWASSARSMFATREILAQYASGMTAEEALRYLPRFGTVRPYDIDCVIVDGTMAAGFFDQYYTNEIESLEITTLDQLTPEERRNCASNGNADIGSGGPPMQRGRGSSSASMRRQHWAALIMLRH
jgi:carboxypeptidase family protein